MKRGRYLWIVLLPMAWLMLCTLTAAWQKVFSADPKIGFLAHARKFSEALAQNQVLAPAQSVLEMRRVVVNDHVDAALALLFIAVVVAIVVLGLRAAWRGARAGAPTAMESPYVPAAS